MLRKDAKRFLGVRNGDQISGELRCPIVGDHRRSGARRERLRNEVVTVEAFAFKRNKEIVARDRAAIRRYAHECGGASEQTPVDGMRGCHRVHHASASFTACASRSATASASP